jgi:hypothetical protein
MHRSKELAATYKAQPNGVGGVHSSTGVVADGVLQLAQASKQYLTDENLKSLQLGALCLFGLNKNTRSSEESRVTEITTLYGCNVIELFKFLRSYMCWAAMDTPGLRDQGRFNDMLKKLICSASYFNRGGLMSPWEWTACSGDTGKGGNVYFLCLLIFDYVLMFAYI